MLSIGVLISGSGSNLQAIIDKVEQGVLDVEIKVVISNNPQAYGLTRAQQYGIPAVVVEHQKFSERKDFEQELINVLEQKGVQIVVLAGFMRVLTSFFIGHYPNKILNIHPALLPSFPGVAAQKQAVEYGAKLAGCTVHFVDEKMDHGPIIIQAALPVLPSDDAKTLSAKILHWEHRIYPQAISWLAQDRIEIVNRQVVIKDAPSSFVDQNSPVLISPGLEPSFV